MYFYPRSRKCISGSHGWHYQYQSILERHCSQLRLVQNILYKDLVRDE